MKSQLLVAVFAVAIFSTSGIVTAKEISLQCVYPKTDAAALGKMDIILETSGGGSLKRLAPYAPHGAVKFESNAKLISTRGIVVGYTFFWKDKTHSFLANINNETGKLALLYEVYDPKLEAGLFSSDPNKKSYDLVGSCTETKQAKAHIEPPIDPLGYANKYECSDAPDVITHNRCDHKSK